MEKRKPPIALKAAVIVVAIGLMSGFVIMRGRGGAHVPGRMASALPLDSPDTKGALLADTFHMDNALPSSKSGIIFPVERSTQAPPAQQVRIDQAPKGTVGDRVVLSSSKSMSPLIEAPPLMNDSVLRATKADTLK